MPGCVKLQTKKVQLVREKRDILMTKAVETYLLELEKLEKERKEARAICSEMSSEY